MIRLELDLHDLHIRDVLVADLELDLLPAKHVRNVSLIRVSVKHLLELLNRSGELAVIVGPRFGGHGRLHVRSGEMVSGGSSSWM